SEIVRSATRRGKKQNLLTPTTFSLIHCTDFADRYERNILPMLKAGFIVLADRYKFTALARDTVRGCPQEWVGQLYSFAFQPDITFYFSLPLRTALGRILVGRPALKYHEAGMDLGLSPDPVESFKIFQGRIHKEYEKLSRRHRFTRIDSDRPVEAIQEEVRAILRDRIDLAHFKVAVPRGWRV
ncbi:MAG: thymidylate kinase, partial [Deltaproteobacteria bacterium]|nr:thymidylate kinase [Deltaproteobacteria bacterium]